MQTFNTPAARRWINEGYEGAASATTWTDQEVLEFVEEYHVDGAAAFTREVINSAPTTQRRTPNQVKATVASLNRKLRRKDRSTRYGHDRPLQFTEAVLEDGVIAVRNVEPDRSLTGQPDKVWAERFLDVNETAVSLYRWARIVDQEGLSAMLKDYLENNPYGPTVTRN